MCRKDELDQGGGRGDDVIDRDAKVPKGVGYPSIHTGEKERTLVI